MLNLARKLSRKPALAVLLLVAEKAFLDREEPSHRRWARISKFITGWAAALILLGLSRRHGGFLAVLVTYIAGVFGLPMPIWQQIIIVLGNLPSWSVYIAIRGVTGSTTASIVINIIQLVSLITFSIMAIMFRVKNPLGVFGRQVGITGQLLSIILPHNLAGLLFQSTIAHPEFLVGFRSPPLPSPLKAQTRKRMSRVL